MVAKKIIARPVVKLTGYKLTLEFDLDVQGKPSKSGETTLLASYYEKETLPDGAQITMSGNIYTKDRE